MTNGNAHQEKLLEVAPSTPSDRIPFRVMRDGVALGPVPRAGRRRGWRLRSLALPSTLKENKEAYGIRADLPGVKEEDLDILADGKPPDDFRQARTGEGTPTGRHLLRQRTFVRVSAAHSRFPTVR